MFGFAVDQLDQQLALREGHVFKDRGVLPFQCPLHALYELLFLFFGRQFGHAALHGLERGVGLLCDRVDDFQVIDQSRVHLPGGVGLCFGLPSENEYGLHLNQNSRIVLSHDSPGNTVFYSGLCGTRQR